MSVTSSEYEEYKSLDDREKAGTERLRWMSNPVEHCPIPRSTTTFEDLLSQGCQILDDKSVDLPKRYHVQAFLLGLPIEAVYRFCSLIKHEKRYVGWEWDGVLGPGVIFLEILMKPAWVKFPRMSEITQAVYQKNFSLDDLRYVFVSDIINTDTRDFIQNYLPELPRGDGGGYTKSTAFEFGTEMYRALLATRIGKMIAYFVLGAFDRGTRRIARINVWFISYKPQMRFDIEALI